MSQFYVKGGPRSNGKHGFIFSNANWDPYPMANDIEAFSIALANMDVAIAQRIVRFSNTFFTVISPSDEVSGDPGRFGLHRAATRCRGIDEEIKAHQPGAARGQALIKTVEDLQTQTRL